MHSKINFILPAEIVTSLQIFMSLPEEIQDQILEIMESTGHAIILKDQTEEKE